MSWSDNNNNDPWGSSGNGSGRRGPGPNMDDVIRNAQNKFKGMMPGSFFGKLGPMVIIGILIFIGIFNINEYNGHGIGVIIQGSFLAIFDTYYAVKIKAKGF